MARQTEEEIPFVTLDELRALDDESLLRWANRLGDLHLRYLEHDEDAHGQVGWINWESGYIHFFDERLRYPRADGRAIPGKHGKMRLPFELVSELAQELASRERSTFDIDGFDDFVIWATEEE